MLLTRCPPLAKHIHLQIINLVCSSASSHCSKQEFALALVLVAQVQGRQFPNVQQAKEALLSSSDIPEPILDLEELSSSMLRSRLSSSISSNRAKESWEATRSKGVRSGLPHASSTLRGFREDSREPSGTRSPLAAPVYIDPNPCSVHPLPELGGYLFFRHVLYLVKTPLSAGVKRRYSDFVSLHEYLITRYPFRLVPPLPPKRLALPHMNRTQLVGSAQQDVFLEQRRLALARYSRNVISHPVFRKDYVVLSFYTLGGLSTGLTEENASTWKNPSVAADGIVEEGLDDSWKLSDSELMSVPIDMEEKLAPTRKMVGVVVDRWNSAVAVFERQVRRMEATAAESTRLSLSLSSLLEVESQTYQGSRIEDYFGQSTSLLISNSQDYSDLSTARFLTLQYTLDGLKNSRDIWLSLKELFKRHEKLGNDPIRDLTIRIEVNRKRWKSTIEEKKPNWKQICSKLKNEIELDQKLIEKFERRNKRVRVTLWHEVTRLQQLENLIVADWKTFARSEAVNLAATRLAAEELVVALDRLTEG